MLPRSVLARMALQDGAFDRASRADAINLFKSSSPAMIHNCSIALISTTCTTCKSLNALAANRVRSTTTTDPKLLDRTPTIFWLCSLAISTPTKGKASFTTQSVTVLDRLYIYTQRPVLFDSCTSLPLKGIWPNCSPTWHRFSSSDWSNLSYSRQWSLSSPMRCTLQWPEFRTAPKRHIPTSRRARWTSHPCCSKLCNVLTELRISHDPRSVITAIDTYPIQDETGGLRVLAVPPIDPATPPNPLASAKLLLEKDVLSRAAAHIADQHIDIDSQLLVVINHIDLSLSQRVRLS